MGKKWDSHKGGRKHWIRWMTSVMEEVYRVLKPGAFGVVWALPRTSHWTATALEDAGFEIRDIITHVQAQGYPKSKDISEALDDHFGIERPIIGVKNNTYDGAHRDPAKHKSPAETSNIGKWGLTKTPHGAPLTAPVSEEARTWEGYGTALKPAAEHWILVQKPLSEKNIVLNVLEHGTGGINLDACRIGWPGGRAPEIGTPSWGGPHKKLCFAPGEDAGDTKERRPPNVKGRHPANFLISHHPECRCTGTQRVRAHGCVNPQKVVNEPTVYGKFDFHPGFTAYGDGDGFETIEQWTCHPDCPLTALNAQYGGEAGRYFKVFEPEYEAPFIFAGKISKKERNAGLPDGMLNKHPTVKSQSLMQYLCQLVTPPGGTVLDPFGGSFSTAVACASLGYSCVIIEQEASSFEVGVARAEAAYGKEAA